MYSTLMQGQKIRQRFLIRNKLPCRVRTEFLCVHDVVSNYDNSLVDKKISPFVMSYWLSSFGEGREKGE